MEECDASQKKAAAESSEEEEVQIVEIFKENPPSQEQLEKNQELQARVNEADQVMKQLK